MDRVVLQLSPETLPYLSGMNFVNEGRLDFDQLLNNLIASGSANRASVVQNILDELLYGWIYEVRREFGHQMEDEVVTLAGYRGGAETVWDVGCRLWVVGCGL